ncbi:MAG: hypothetical protein ACXQT4_01805 [Methanotrichaceae archaeon]
MKRFMTILILALLLIAGTSTAHRMLLGYKVNELQLNTIYDDGTPAQDAHIDIYKDGKLYAEGMTDSSGSYIFRPEGEKVGDLTFVSSSVGHRAELALNMEEKNDENEMPLPMRVVAGFGYLIGLAGISMIYVSKKKK